MKRLGLERKIFWRELVFFGVCLPLPACMKDGRGSPPPYVIRSLALAEMHPLRFRGPEDWEKSCGSEGLRGQSREQKRCIGSRWHLSWRYSRDAQGFLVDQRWVPWRWAGQCHFDSLPRDDLEGKCDPKRGSGPTGTQKLRGNCVWSAEGRRRRVRFRSFILHWAGSF